MDAQMVWQPRALAPDGRRRIERRWELRLVRWGAALVQVTEEAAATNSIVLRRDTAPSRRPARVITTILLTASLGLVWAFAFPGIGRSESGARASLSILLDDPVALKREKRATERSYVTRAKADLAEHPVARIDTEVLERDEPSAFVTETTDAMPSLPVALAQALRGGEPLAWENPSAGESGMVVVGPAEQANGRSCRDVAIFTRGGEGVPDRTANSRECMSGSVERSAK